MTIAVPVPGLVIRYAYLWSDEADRGRENSSKDRPCAVLLSTVMRSGKEIVTVLPITHSLPLDQAFAVELPTATKRRLGLDDERSWIVLTEANRFIWPGPDLRPVPNTQDGSFSYGLLPAALYEEVRTKWLAAFDLQRVRDVIRTE